MKKLKTWWFLFTVGLTLCLMGAYSLIYPGMAYTKLPKYSALLLILNGFLLFIVSILHTKDKKEKVWILIESVINLFFGMVLLVNPFFSLLAYPFLIGHWMIGISIVKIIASFRVRKELRGWAFILSSGVLSLFFGFLIAYTSFTKATDITYFIGIFGVTMGIVTIFDAFRFRKTDDTLNLLF